MFSNHALKREVKKEARMLTLNILREYAKAAKKKQSVTLFLMRLSLRLSLHLQEIKHYVFEDFARIGLGISWSRENIITIPAPCAHGERIGRRRGGDNEKNGC
ncbi:MAG: hypothetical protein WC459_03775 [Patescibacteria group bacterium]